MRSKDCDGEGFGVWFMRNGSEGGGGMRVFAEYVHKQQLTRHCTLQNSCY